MESAVIAAADSITRAVRKVRQPTPALATALAFVLALAIVGVVLVAASINHAVPWDQLDFGNVPGWISALFSLAAIVGVGIAVLTYRQNQRDRRDDEANQARLVFPAIRGSSHTGVIDSQRAQSIDVSCGAAVHNSSGQPVLFVQVASVVVHLKSDPGRSHATALTYAGDVVTREANNVVPSGKTSVKEVWIGRLTGQELGSLEDGVRFSIAARYTDIQGREWERIDNYAPRRIYTNTESSNPPSDLRELHRNQ